MQNNLHLNRYFLYIILLGIKTDNYKLLNTFGEIEIFQIYLVFL